MKTKVDSSKNEKMGKKIKVYFDGLCVVCSREIEVYRAQPGSENIEFIDICGPGFDPILEGLNPKLVHREMHARRGDGSLAIGVDAFITIWETLPHFHLLGKWAKNSLVHGFLEVGYSLFVRIRPLLPRRAAALDCQNSPYCDLGKVK